MKSMGYGRFLLAKAAIAGMVIGVFLAVAPVQAVEDSRVALSGGDQQEIILAPDESVVLDAP